MTHKYHQLNQEQRYQIQVLRKENFSLQAIAERICVNKSTISRELKRNSSSKGNYNALCAQTYCNDRRSDNNYNQRFSEEMKNFIDEKLGRQQWSPEQISGYCKANNIGMVSHETIYQYIYEEQKQGGTLYLQLRTKQKKRKNRSHKKQKRGLIANRVSIHQRPEIVETKQRFGDWEADLIEGGNHKSFAVTLVERKSQFAMIIKSENKQSDTVRSKIINALAPYKQLVHTITSDNGKEFSEHEKIARKLNADFYFADPYSSYQRGLSEYTNKLFRQYFPKKTNLKNYETKDFIEAENKLNNRPRKLLGYKTPLQVFIHNFDNNIINNVALQT